MIEPLAAEHIAAHHIVGSRGGGIVFADMRRALEPGAARPLKDGREAFGRALIFGPVETDATTYSCGCPSTSSGITRSGVWQDRTNSRETLYTKSGRTR